MSGNGKLSRIEGVKEQMRLPPQSIASSCWWRSEGTLRHAVGRTFPMMHKTPFADPLPDRDDHCGEPASSELIARPKTVFQWPPDCVWPFMDRGSDTDT
jgi:hypothetical protein